MLAALRVSSRPHLLELGATLGDQATHPKDLILVLVVHHTQQGCKAISSHTEESVLLCWVGLWKNEGSENTMYI